MGQALVYLVAPDLSPAVRAALGSDVAALAAAGVPARACPPGDREDPPGISVAAGLSAALARAGAAGRRPGVIVPPGDAERLAGGESASLPAASRALAGRPVLVRSPGDRARLEALGLGGAGVTALPWPGSPVPPGVDPPRTLRRVLAGSADPALPALVARAVEAAGRSGSLEAAAVPPGAGADLRVLDPLILAADAVVVSGPGDADLAHRAASLRRPLIVAEGLGEEDFAWPGINALDFPAGDAGALAAVLLRLASRPDEVAALGLGGPLVAAARHPEAVARRLARWAGAAPDGVAP